MFFAFLPLKHHYFVEMSYTNIKCIDDTNLDIVCIGLFKNKKKFFAHVETQLRAESLVVVYNEGIDGKELSLEQCKTQITSKYKQFFIDNQNQIEKKLKQVNYMGHLACSLTHVKILENAIHDHYTLILEEDADIQHDFRKRLIHCVDALNKLDEEWDILLLGFSCDYKHHFYHKLNDQEPMHPVNNNGEEQYIARVHAWIGGWAMLYRPHVKEWLLPHLTPLNWHIDIAISDLARLGKIKAYGCLPPLVFHPGYLRLSSWDYEQVGNTQFMKTDTNIPV